jgi:hypothetical protein
VYDGTTRVDTYTNDNLGGSKASYGVGEWASLNNDTMTSLRIPKGLKATLYSDSNFGGSQLNLEANDHMNLGHFSFPSGQYKGRDVCQAANSFCWNDSASSMKVYLA